MQIKFDKNILSTGNLTDNKNCKKNCIFRNIYKSPMRSIITTVTILIFACIQPVSGQFKSLPENQSKYHVVDFSELSQRAVTNFIETPSPVGDKKSIAEFEKMQGVIVAYNGNLGIPVTAIAEMSQEILVYMLVENQNDQNDISSYLVNNGADMNNIDFIQTPLNSYWTRDYSPWFIRESQDISIVDFPYNRPRPDDDEIPVVMANYLGTDLYGMNMLHTGGNYMTDGMGKSLSTQLVAEENTNLSATEIQQMAEDYLGVSDYELLNDPLDEYIEHIDCWSKFLSVDKILIGSVPVSDYRYADFEALADYFENKPSSYGTNYKVYRTYSPNDQPYTNSLILNNRVFVPIVTGTGSQWNDTAIAAYQQAMPGYDIIGVEETNWINWYNTDAFHCRTHGVPDLGMLYIKHIPLHGEQPYQSSGQVITCDITAYSDSALVADSLRLYYKTQSTSYSYVNLVNNSGNTYFATITGLNYSDTVQYYFDVYDKTGRNAKHPVMGDIEPHSFFIEEYVQSVSNIINDDLLKVFPNPSSGIIYVKSDFSNLQVISLDGKILVQKPISKTYEKLDLGSLAKGIYLVRVTKENQTRVERLIIY